MVLILIILLDVFLTVLYARLQTRKRSVLLRSGHPRAAGRGLGSRADARGALIMHPELGTSVRATDGEIPTDLVTAMYAGGTSMALVGAGDFTPQTSPMRPLFLFSWPTGRPVPRPTSPAECGGTIISRTWLPRWLRASRRSTRQSAVSTLSTARTIPGPVCMSPNSGPEERRHAIASRAVFAPKHHATALGSTACARVRNRGGRLPPRVRGRSRR